MDIMFIKYSSYQHLQPPSFPLIQAPSFRKLKFNLTPVYSPCPFFATALKPPGQILALRHVKQLEKITAFDNSLNSDARDPYAASNGQLFQFQEMQTDTSERRVRDRRTAEAELESREVRTSK